MASQYVMDNGNFISNRMDNSGNNPKNITTEKQSEMDIAFDELNTSIECIVSSLKNLSKKLEPISVSRIPPPSSNGKAGLSKESSAMRGRLAILKDKIDCCDINIRDIVSNLEI
jgi:hypothetical protein